MTLRKRNFRVLNPALDRVVARLAKQRRQLIAGAPGEIAVFRSDHEVGAIFALPEKGIAADCNAGIGGFRSAKQVRDVALGCTRADRD